MASGTSLAAAALVCLLLAGADASGQCILANPSFEIAGSGGAVHGGWNQFGAVGSTTEAVHGSRAVVLTGPGTGVWDVSGIWQAQDCSPGEQWSISGHVAHAGAAPLTGQCSALVNVEWRDAADALISYDSFPVATSASPTSTYAAFSLTSSAAPAGTATARLLLGVLQSPTDPAPDVLFDQVTFFSTSAPTIDDVQWNDFPGPRTLDFAGRTWRIKGPGVHGPGNNFFTNSVNSVWVDADGLHLTVKDLGWTWACTEVVPEEALGYGDYIVTTVGALDLIDPQSVLGLFLWEYGPCWSDGYLWWNAFNEVDIEYSRWGSAGNGIAQFVAQPWDHPGNLERFDAAFGSDEVASHAIRWLADRVEYRVWRGGPGQESSSPLVHSWTYTGPHIPRPEQPRLHLNFWKLDGTPATDQEVVIQDFVFIPEGVSTAVGSGRVPEVMPQATARLLLPSPNPFNPSTTIRWEQDRAGSIELRIVDTRGRLLRTLADGHHDAGEHTATWDGRDARGLPMGSGVYMVLMLGLDSIETRRLVLAK